jgi:CubicO group peptidase (beta-lactamase class C family)
VDYTTTVVPDSKGQYGASFWLNADGGLSLSSEKMYMCRGHNGQRIFIFPDEELAVVVLGYSRKKNNDMDFNALLGDVLDALKD